MNSVKFRVDDNSEMLELYINDKLVNAGNFWDFDFVRDVPNLPDKLGIKNHIEEYDYDNDDFYEEDDNEPEEG